MAERLGKGIKRYFKDNLGILCALAVMILFLYVYPVTHTTFLTQRNIFNVLRQSAPNLLLACGMTMVIILGGIDLSVGSIIAMSGVLGAAAVVWWGLPEIVGILIGILSGVIFGLFNGAIIAKTQIPPFIVTLASMNIAKGIAYVYSGGKPIRCMTDAWKFLGAGYIGPVPTQVVTMFVVFIIAVLFLNRTRMGRHIYAVGGNEKATKLSGINTKKVYFFAYANMGFLAALAGVLTIARMASAQPTYGDGYEMDAIGACFIGGASAYGGVGTVPGVIVGAVLMGVINLGMSVMGIDQNFQKVVKGGVLLAAVVFDVLSKREDS